MARSDDPLVNIDLAIYAALAAGFDAESVMEQCQISVDNNRWDFEEIPEDE